MEKEEMSAQPKIRKADDQPKEMRRRMATLIRSASGKDAQPEAVRAFEEFAAAHPEMIADVRLVSASIEGALEGMLTGGSAVSATFLDQEIKEVRAGLGYAEASEIERMMIDRVVLCWLRVLYAEWRLSILQSRTCAIRELELAERSLLLAHTRHIRAVEALARLSKLARSRKPTSYQIRAVEELARRRRDRKMS
jgi:hypothetical protein